VPKDHAEVSAVTSRRHVIDHRYLSIQTTIPTITAGHSLSPRSFTRLPWASLAVGCPPIKPGGEGQAYHVPHQSRKIG